MRNRGFLVLGTCLTITLAVRAQEDSPQDPETSDPPQASSSAAESLRIAARAGLWGIPGFRTTVPGGSREFSSRIALDLGLDLSLPLDSFFVTLSGDFARSARVDVTALSLTGGVETGLGELFGEPLSLRLGGGPLLASLDHDESQFGDFDSGWGFLGRAEAGLPVLESVHASLWTDIRWVEFDYEETVIGGDDSAGGLMWAAGLSLDLRF